MPPQPRDTLTRDGAPSSVAPRRLGRPPTYAPEDERSMMIRAAYRVLVRHRAGSIPVSDICAEAGLSTRSFYRQFKSKDELLLAMFEAESARAESELAERMDRAADPRAAIEDWVRFFLALAFDSRRRRRVLIMQSPEVTRVSGYAAALARMQERNRAPLIRALEAGAADGSFRHACPASDAVMIQDIVSCFVARRRDAIGLVDANTALAVVLDFLSRAIGMPA
jgi:AcrR family transcriptional regulator